MRIAYGWLLVFGTTLVHFTPAQACECAGYSTEFEALQAEIKRLPHYDAAIDGVVVRVSRDTFGRGYTAYLKPQHIWFGPRQKLFLVKKSTDCQADFFEGGTVRVALTLTPQNTGSFARFIALFWPTRRTYSSDFCSNFAQAMDYARMRQAVMKRTPR